MSKPHLNHPSSWLCISNTLSGYLLPLDVYADIWVQHHEPLVAQEPLQQILSVSFVGIDLVRRYYCNAGIKTSIRDWLAKRQCLLLVKDIYYC